ncbi:DUF3024 domain-containing protein [Longimicrobium terrae]|uniref:DUF3024 domain-containing protein n=1 Tax=Longimicrobium terrae TaxID=1639882 RepID=A0A841GMM6_9BACT|nr:DUF3024 domain-containing protein [Longimicrobium terrae]MBB4635483.1 hypothetical protein [Longimicrobium terrae]MBB6069877.1 hypothetical protein [Longimicrobium terrae]NNC32792.1 DUF3024 domain-containing protein [Longimicrobium terrae]
MALPPLVAEAARVLLDAYCRNRVPAHAADEVRMSWTVRGATISLTEQRCHWKRREEWGDRVVAKFKYAESDGKWELYWGDRNDRFHQYQDLAPVSLKRCLAEVDSDPLGIFWG